MSHFSVLLITPTKPSEAEIERLLAPYDENLETEERFEEVDIERMAELLGVDPTDKAAALAKVEDWTGSPGILRDDGVIGHMTKYNENAKWDWYQVGGRWSGQLNPDYEPDKDPRNQERCDICNGSGIRDDEIGIAAREKDPNYKCNRCEGKGWAVKWPTEWVAYDGNQVQVKNLPKGADLNFFAYLRDGQWLERGEMGWFGAVHDEKDDGAWEKQKAELRASLKPDEWLTVIDMHI